jgi:hypothetical protein
MEAARRSACLILALAAVAGCGGSKTTDDQVACRVERGVLPEWARTGFSDPEPKMPHVVGNSGQIAAVLFGDPLTSPPAPDRSNKILWVARETPQPPAQLTIQARQGDRTVTRKVDVGPSYVDLPAGCWRLSLSWTGGHKDTLDLQYTKHQP